MPDIHTNAATIQVCGFNVDDLEAITLQELPERQQCVILKVLVANVVKGVDLEHRRQIVHLDNPEALWIKTGPRIANKSVGVFQVIKHRNAGDDFGTLAGKRLVESVEIEKVIDDS